MEMKILEKVVKSKAKDMKKELGIDNEKGGKKVKARPSAR